MSEAGPSLQERWAKGNRCFGCGPANEHGLRIRSFADGGEVVCTWTPQPHHEAFGGFLNGGIIGALLDCHCNWTAIEHLIRTRGLAEAPCTVTAELHVLFRRPTPSPDDLHLTNQEADLLRQRSSTPNGSWQEILRRRSEALARGGLAAVGPYANDDSISSVSEFRGLLTLAPKAAQHFRPIIAARAIFPGGKPASEAVGMMPPDQ